ncbi:hypothetical protein KCV00_g99, partial [Aureobasidium melanogenum]
MSRERSPFRQNSPFAAPASSNFKSPGPFLATAADSRRQQREEASAREWMSHQPKLRRETTKTMSPKDALLDFNDSEGSDMPLFADTLPSGYNFASSMAAPPTNVAGFRASSSDQSSIGSSTFNFLPPQQPVMPSNPYASAHYRPTDFNAEPTPDFPAHLATMESSMSEGPGASSQGSMTAASTSRPQHTTADTGSYTCTADGCYQRFDSAVKLQKHRRDAHPARQSLSSTGTATSSPEEDRRSSSPVTGTLGSSMTAAALAERNSQQGPHKCTRINPSTGKPCNSIFSRPYDLTRHEDTIHNRQKQKLFTPRSTSTTDNIHRMDQISSPSTRDRVISSTRQHGKSFPSHLPSLHAGFVPSLFPPASFDRTRERAVSPTNTNLSLLCSSMSEYLIGASRIHEVLQEHRGCAL